MLAWTACFLLLTVNPGWGENRALGHALAWIEGDFPSLGRWSVTTGDKFSVAGRDIPLGMIGQTLLALPSAALAERMATMVGDDRLPQPARPAFLFMQQYPRRTIPQGQPLPTDLPIGRLFLAGMIQSLGVVAVAYGVLALCFARVLRSVAPPRRRALLVLLLLGSPTLYLARLSSAILPSMMFTLVAFVLLAVESPRPAWAGFCAGVSVLCYFPQAPCLAALLGFTAYRIGLAGLRRFLSACAPPLLIAWGFNFIVTGSWWKPAYLMREHDTALWTSISPLGAPAMLYELLLGPRRGLFLWAPVYLGAVWGLWRGARTGRWTPIEKAGWATFLGYLVLLLPFREIGLYGPGTVSRHLALALPLPLLSLAHLDIRPRTLWLVGLPMALFSFVLSVHGPLALPGPGDPDIGSILAAPLRTGFRPLPAGWPVAEAMTQIHLFGWPALLALFASAVLFVCRGAVRGFFLALAVALVLASVHHATALGWMATRERWDHVAEQVTLAGGDAKSIDVAGSRPTLGLMIASELPPPPPGAMIEVIIVGDAGIETQVICFCDRTKGAIVPSSPPQELEGGVFRYRHDIPVRGDRIRSIRFRSPDAAAGYIWRLDAVIAEVSPSDSRTSASDD